MLNPPLKLASLSSQDVIRPEKMVPNPLGGHGIPTIDLVLLTLSLTLLVAVFTLGIRI